MFIDRCKVHIKAGDGGSGHCSFRREKYVPRGGPDGGDGGHGGDVIAQLDEGQHVLVDLHGRPFYRAEDGARGQGSNKTGADGKSIVLLVPPGTVFYNEEDGEVVADITHANPSAVLARGGYGGKGNARFTTSSNRAPRKITPGKEGVELHLIAELKMVADVGLVGYPNAGKSTLINQITKAHAKIGDYPFTTLHPVLGTIILPTGRRLVVADIPGIIEGASQGAGLGLDFLRHIERTSMLVYVIDIGPGRESSPEAAFAALRGEIDTHDPSILTRPSIVALNKIDLLPQDTAQEERERFVRESGCAADVPVLLISAHEGQHTDLLADTIQRLWLEGQDTTADDAEDQDPT